MSTSAGSITDWIEAHHAITRCTIDIDWKSRRFNLGQFDTTSLNMDMSRTTSLTTAGKQTPGVTAATDPRGVTAIQAQVA